LTGPPWPVPTVGSPSPLGGEPFPDKLLRFGVQCADGRRVSNMDGHPWSWVEIDAGCPGRSRDGAPYFASEAGS
jgi:hypothetical protein